MPNQMSNEVATVDVNFDNEDIRLGASNNLYYGGHVNLAEFCHEGKYTLVIIHPKYRGSIL